MDEHNKKMVQDIVNKLHEKIMVEEDTRSLNDLIKAFNTSIGFLESKGKTGRSDLGNLVRNKGKKITTKVAKE